MDWIIGDIHGCLSELEILLDRIGSEAHLIFVGDYIDRGPDSFQVVERLLREKHRSTFLMGNHEAMMLNFFKSPNSPGHTAWTYWANGGQETLRSYGLKEDETNFELLPDKHREFYKNLELYYEGDDFIVVHAGVRPSESQDMKKQYMEDLLWIRMEWIRSEHLWAGKKVYYGHTPSLYIYGPDRQQRPIYGKNSVGIDTGCVYGGYLTAINQATGDLIQVRAKKAYLPI